jgi:hypothetical protein
MRLFVTVADASADAILLDGWTDTYSLGSVNGVHLSDCPLDYRHGFFDPVVLCVEVAEDAFERYEQVNEKRPAPKYVPGIPFLPLDAPPAAYRYAIIPAAVLNQIGKPQLYDQEYARCSRKEVLLAIRDWEGRTDPQALTLVRSMRESLEFLDRHDWRTPLRLREETAK